MKSRPRSIERRSAEILSEIFSSLGYSSVKRVPVLGRTGPDLEINEFGLVIDVKSRLQVPASYLTDRFTLFNDYLIGTPLKYAGELVYGNYALRVPTSKIVHEWYEHMNEWTSVNMPDGISALIIHKPGMRISDAMLVISLKDRKEFQTRWLTKPNPLQPCSPLRTNPYLRR